MQASISPEAKIGSNVTFGYGVVVHPNVEIGDNTIIEDFSIIGYPTRLAEGKPLVIGPDSHIRSHSVLYEGSTFGRRLITGHSVLVRENTVAGPYLQIGTNSDIEGDTEIGSYTKIHSEVHIGKGSKIGDLVWFFPRVQFTNDPFPPSDCFEGITIGHMAVILTNTLLFPGVHVGMGAVVTGGSVVRSSVPDVMCVGGNPAKTIARIDQIRSLKYDVQYPWPKHFRKGYPEESFTRMDELVQQIDERIALLREKKKTV